MTVNVVRKNKAGKGDKVGFCVSEGLSACLPVCVHTAVMAVLRRAHLVFSHLHDFAHVILSI